MPSNLPNPTPQGLEIIKAWTETKTCIMINALAGTGKTTFLRQLAPYIKEKKVLCLAFNKKNATELEAVLPPHFTCATLNSIGHRALGRALAKYLQVDGEKTSKILKGVLAQMGTKLEGDAWTDVVQLVGRAKTSGLMPKKFIAFKSLLPDDLSSWETLAEGLGLFEVSESTYELAHTVLTESVTQAIKEGIIDYDDQIYLSTLANGAFEKYDVVLVDEAQDLSPLNHLQLKKSLELKGRLLVVGDPKQAIYAFRGASSKSMAEIREIRPNNFQEFPLSLTFRCPKLVVARNLEHAPGFEAAPSNKEGRFFSFLGKEWSIDDLIHDKPAILCRNTSPLLSAAFRLIRSGRGVTFLGRDIGKNLTRLLHKICGTKSGLPIEEILSKVNAWMEKERRLATANGKMGLLDLIEDRGGSLLAVAEGCGGETLGQVEKAILDLFTNQSALITLGTAHRAKGMEWDLVVHLDPWRLPSKQAQKAEDQGFPGPMEQEMNLKYVLETRTKDVLVVGNLKEFQP